MIILVNLSKDPEKKYKRFVVTYVILFHPIRLL